MLLSLSYTTGFEAKGNLVSSILKILQGLSERSFSERVSSSIMIKICFYDSTVSVFESCTRLKGGSNSQQETLVSLAEMFLPPMGNGYFRPLWSQSF